MAVNSALALLITAQDKTAGPLRRVGKDVAALSKNVEKMNKSFKGFSGAQLAATVGLTGLGAAATAAGFSFNSMKETATIAFNTLLNSEQKGKQFFEELTAFAKKTPFDLEGVTEASRKLLGFGFAADEVIPLLKDVGDAVGAMGGGSEMIDRVTTALGQMRTKGKASAEEMMQLAEAGIPVWQMLADNIDQVVGPQKAAAMAAKRAERIRLLMQPTERGGRGMTLADATEAANTAQQKQLAKLMETGKLPASKAIAMIRKGMAQRFGDIGAKQADTFKGGLEALNESFKQLMGTLTGSAFGTAKDAVQGLTRILDGLQKPAEELMKSDILPKELKSVIGVSAALGGFALGEVGSLLGGGGGKSIETTLIVLAIGAGVAVLVSSLLLIKAAVDAVTGLAEKIWSTLKSALHVIVDNWPSGGGGGGGAGGAGLPPIPAVVAVMLKPGTKEDVQRQVDAWGALGVKMGVTLPPATDAQHQVDAWSLTKQLWLSLPLVGDVQRILDSWGGLHATLGLTLPAQRTVQDQLDVWTLTKTLALGLPVVGDLQRMLDATDDLKKDLALRLPDWTDVQRRIGQLPDVVHALQLSIPGWSVIQAVIDAWPTLATGLDLMPTAPQDIQGRIDAWPVLWTTLGLIPPAPADVQGMLDEWDRMLLKTGLVVPPQTDVQTGLDAAYPSGFRLWSWLKLPSVDDVQRALDGWLLRLGTWFGLPNGGDVQTAVDDAYDLRLDTWLKIPPQSDVQRGLEAAYPNLSLGAKLNITPPSWLPGGVTTVPGGGASGWVNGSPLPKFALGGVVPGPRGAPSLAMVHGGETITPAGRGGGQTIVVNITTPAIVGANQLEDIVVAAIDRATRRGRIG